MRIFHTYHDKKSRQYKNHLPVDSVSEDIAKEFWGKDDDKFVFGMLFVDFVDGWGGEQTKWMV